MRSTRRALFCAAALPLGFLLLAGPAAAQEEGGEELSPEATAAIDAIQENDQILADLSDEDREEVIHTLEEEAKANGTNKYDAECIVILVDGGSPGDCEEAPNPLLPEKNEIIWGGLGFLIVFIFLAKVGYPQIKKGMAARADRIRADLEGAESAKTDAQRVLEEYRAQLTDARAEAGRIIEEARQQADTLKREQEQRLQTEAAAARERAAADAEAARSQILADLQGEVATLVSEGVDRVVRGGLDQATKSRLVDEYIASIGSSRN